MRRTQRFLATPRSLCVASAPRAVARPATVDRDNGAAEPSSGWRVAIMVASLLLILFFGWDRWSARQDAQQDMAEAASQGDCARLARLLDRGVPCNCEDSIGITPLIYAATAGQADAARVLLSAGADPNRLSPYGLSPLQMAALRGDVETVHVLMKSGARVEHADRQGGTPLMVASAAGHLQVVELLLDAGADPSRTNAEGYTALDLARDANSPAHVIEQLRSATLKRRAMSMASLDG